MTETIDRLETRPLSRDQAIRRLKALEPEIRAMGIVSLYLFGSTARDEAGPDSDVDLFGDLEPGRVFGWDYAGLPREIGALIHQRTDFIARGGLHPMLKDRIEASALRIF
jgi:uncharacterized protein